VRKSVILLLLSVAFATQAFAQKMELTNAILQIAESDKYPKSLPKALENLKKVAANPEMAKGAKYIFTRGKLYLAFASCAIPEIRTLGGDSAIDVAAKCFEKVLTLEEEIPEFKREFSNEAQYNLYVKLPPVAYNYGVGDFQKENYARAAEYFYKSAIFNRAKIPNSKAYKYDTNSHINAIIAGCKAGNPDIIVGALFLGSRRKVVGLDMYQTAIQYLERSPYVDGYKAAIDSARIKFPKNQEFLRSELNFYLGRQEFELVLEKTEKLIKLEPENGQLYFVRGVMLEEKAKVTKKREQRQALKDRALADYIKATTIDSTQVGAYYNSALYYVNSVKGTIDSVNEYVALPKTQFKAVEGKVMAMEKRIDVAYERAIPYFEKCYERDKTNMDALKALVLMYGQLNNEKKSMFYSDKMDEVEKMKKAEKK
jgi:hypothetical protein